MFRRNRHRRGDTAPAAELSPGSSRSCPRRVRPQPVRRHGSGPVAQRRLQSLRSPRGLSQTSPRGTLRAPQAGPVPPVLQEQTEAPGLRLLPQRVEPEAQVTSSPELASGPRLPHVAMTLALEIARRVLPEPRLDGALPARARWSCWWPVSPRPWTVGRGRGVWRQLVRVCSGSGWSCRPRDPAFLCVVNNSHVASVCETSLSFTCLSSC